MRTSWTYVTLLLLVFILLLGQCQAQEFDQVVQCFARGDLKTRAFLRTLPSVESDGRKNYRLTLLGSVDNDTATAFRIKLQLPENAVWWNRSVIYSQNGPLPVDFNLEPSGTLIWRIEKPKAGIQDFVLWLNFSAPGEPVVRVLGESISELKRTGMARESENNIDNDVGALGCLDELIETICE